MHTFSRRCLFSIRDNFYVMFWSEWAACCVKFVHRIFFDFLRCCALKCLGDVLGCIVAQDILTMALSIICGCVGCVKLVPFLVCFGMDETPTLRSNISFGWMLCGIVVNFCPTQRSSRSTSTWWPNILLRWEILRFEFQSTSHSFLPWCSWDRRILQILFGRYVHKYFVFW